ncbi:unnamed protein product [Diplocarpon coronariae]|nr:hypothetical protein JHW43_007962 [Diplocarpon mali]
MLEYPALLARNGNWKIMPQTRRRRLATCMAVVLIGARTRPGQEIVSRLLEHLRVEDGRRAGSSVHHLQHRKGLSPFSESPYAWIHPPKSHERNEQQDPAEDCEPENGIDEIVKDEVLLLERTGSERFEAGLSHRSWVFLGVHIRTLIWIEAEQGRLDRPLGWTVEAQREI